MSCRFSVSNAEMQDLTPARFRAFLCAVAVESLVEYADWIRSNSYLISIISPVETEDPVSSR